MNALWRIIGFLTACFALSAHGECINQEGRILGPLPVVTTATLFNTSNADAVVSAMQIFPATSAWNEDISRRPLLSNSTAMISRIIADLDTINTNRRNLRVFYEMNYVLVPTNQARIPIEFVDYPDESDLEGGTNPVGLYPIPTNQPVETWPHDNTNTLSNWQIDFDDEGGDRHGIIVQPENGVAGGSIWETWQTLRTGTNWSASNGARFDLKSNTLRPAGWTSGDAAGLPMFAALPRYDECERGMVEHACRIVVHSSRYGSYIYPATHFAAPAANTNPDLPHMGQRVRLKSSFVIPPSWAREEKALLLGLKKYGAIVADNGGFFSISVTPDDRWPANAFSHVSGVGITNFEVIQTTGASEGPRSPNPPVADAGPDWTVGVNVPVTLAGFVTSTNLISTNLWKLYSGPGTVTFGDPSQTNTTATFSAPGVYTLLLSADDGTHAVAYDAAVFTAGSNALRISDVTVSNSNLMVTWSGGTAPYIVQQSTDLPAVWSGVVTTAQQNASLPTTNGRTFFRVLGQ